MVNTTRLWYTQHAGVINVEGLTTNYLPFMHMLIYACSLICLEARVISDLIMFPSFDNHCNKRWTCHQFTLLTVEHTSFFNQTGGVSPTGYILKLIIVQKVHKLKK